MRIAIGNYVLSAALSFILHLLVEAPTVQLDKFLFGSTKSGASSAKKTDAEAAHPSENVKPPPDHQHNIRIDPATKL